MRRMGGVSRKIEELRRVPYALTYRRMYERTDDVREKGQ